MTVRMVETVHLADAGQQVKWAFQDLVVRWVKSAPLVRTAGCMARQGRLAQQATIDAFSNKPMLLFCPPFT
jgi:hypothetical protein